MYFKTIDINFRTTLVQYYSTAVRLLVTDVSGSTEI